MHYKPFTLQPGKTWRLLFYRCRNSTLFLFPSLPFTRNPELNSLPAYSTLPLAGSPRLFPANPGVNGLIPWTGAGEALEQLPHSLAVPGPAHACSRLHRDPFPCAPAFLWPQGCRKPSHCSSYIRKCPGRASLGFVTQLPCLLSSSPLSAARKSGRQATAGITNPARQGGLHANLADLGFQQRFAGLLQPGLSPPGLGAQG